MTAAKKQNLIARPNTVYYINYVGECKMTVSLTSCSDMADKICDTSAAVEQGSYPSRQVPEREGVTDDGLDKEIRSAARRSQHLKASAGDPETCHRYPLH